MISEALRDIGFCGKEERMDRLLTRDDFRESVFARDGYKCVFCGAGGEGVPLDAHHLIERRLWAAPEELGGYYLDNGVTVCNPCHIRAEETTLSCAELRAAAGITRILLPEHLYDDFEYDKWGNIIQPNGTRLRGELYYDDSVQKILEQGGVLGMFVPYVKYPRTHHLPWSNPKTDDKFLPTTRYLDGEEVVVTVKMDGEQTSMYTDHIHARSLEMLVGEDATWAKTVWGRIRHDIPAGWRLCGENVYAHHSLYYRHILPPYFYVFSVWNEINICQSWQETQDWATLLELESVPVLYRGPWDEGVLRELYQETYHNDPCEGYVVRVARAFDYGEFKHVVAKFVRPDFVPGHARHWKAGPKVYNGNPNYISE
jgi:hypothetical protein